MEEHRSACREHCPCGSTHASDPSVGGDPIEPVDPDPLPVPAEPVTVIGTLDCGDNDVVEDRFANDGQEPLDVAMEYSPDAFRVESLNPLQWEAFDENGRVVALLAIGDDDVQDWQVWTCE